jgi:hypothetical protein
VVVVGFFAGNDLQDAERFAHFEQDASFRPSFAYGWKFKEVVARFDNLYVVSFARGVTSLLQHPALGREQPSEPDAYSGDDPAAPGVSRAGFDRGLFTVPVAGRTLHFAFLPAYLNTLRFTRAELEAWPGWALTREAYRHMDREVRAAGARLVVMFIPHKAQVYLPLLQASLPPAELARALEATLRQPDRPLDLRAMLDNRLAMNGLMRDFCAQEGSSSSISRRLCRGESRRGRTCTSPTIPTGTRPDMMRLVRLSRCGFGLRKAREAFHGPRDSLHCVLTLSIIFSAVCLTFPTVWSS